MDNKKYTAMDIANYIVNLVNVPDKKLCTLTHIKLQKILYYVQATYMAKNGGTPLFTNDIEKWQYGPVVREVYSEFKDFGISHINTTRSYLVREEKGNFQLVDTDICAIENDINISSHIKEDTYRATQKAPNAKVIAVHMDAINHMSVTRAQLAEYVKDKGIQDKVLIPIDGETLSF